MTSYIIEGLDRLGKSSLINGLKTKFGYFHEIHYSKPILSEAYHNSAYEYQYASFSSGFDLLNCSSRIPVIMDRFHLGECVYAPLYRKYNGNYVFDLEQKYKINLNSNIKLILLTSSDLSFQKDDGDSFDWAKREQEQQLFINAFNKSIFANKKLIDVSNGCGGYKSYTDILNEAISGD
jgi:hypothetical protein